MIRLSRSNGVTILLIEQNMKLAEKVANEIAIMVKGRIVYAATPNNQFCPHAAAKRGRTPSALHSGHIAANSFSDPKIAHEQSPMGK